MMEITAVGLLVFILAGLAVYFIPSIVAITRSHNVAGVLIVNLLLGWSFIGWVVALVMACGSKPQPVVYQVHHQYPAGTYPPASHQQVPYTH